MADSKEAQYRVQRNTALKKVKVLETLLEGAGVDSTKIRLAEALFSGTQVEVKDGQVTSFNVSDGEKTTIKTLLGLKQDPPKGDPPKDPPKDDKPDLGKQIADAVAAALKEAGVTGDGEKKTPPNKPGGTQPPTGGSGSGGLTAEAIKKMSPEQINKNWDQLKAQLADGSLVAQ